MSNKLEVSVTQCGVCGTLSIHWGVQTPTCTACHNAMDELHSALDSEQFSSAIDLEINKWMDDPSMDESFLENLERLTTIDLSYDDDSSTHPIFGAREWYEINQAVPLLNSIANTIVDENEALTAHLAEINEILLEPSSHWTYMQTLELSRMKIEGKVDRINESILECQSLGYDVVDFEVALISALSTLPEFWFEGKDGVYPSGTACFFYDGSDNSFNSYTNLGEPSHYRRHFNRPT